jgi:hypothetical protein
MFKRFFIFLFLLAVLITSCQQSKNGSVTLHGVLLVRDPDNAMPAADNAIYLVPLPAEQMVISVPTIPLENPIQARVNNKNGDFVFTNIQPGKYIVMVLTISNGQIPAHKEDGSLAVIDVLETERNTTIQLNYLSVP